MTIEEIPSHNHGKKELEGTWKQTGENYSTGWYSSSGVVSHTTSSGSKAAIKSSSSYSNQGNIFSIDASHTHNSEGNNQPHNLLSPYLVVNIWERVS